MKILVTGGAGFIGSAVIRNLIKHGDHQVCNVDNLTYASNLESLSDVELSGRLETKVVDICDFSALKACFELFSPDAVMHLAAESHVDNSILSPESFINTNIETLSRNPRMGMVMMSYRKLKKDRKDYLLNIANEFIAKKTN